MFEAVSSRSSATLRLCTTVVTPRSMAVWLDNIEFHACMRPTVDLLATLAATSVSRCESMFRVEHARSQRHGWPSYKKGCSYT